MPGAPKITRLKATAAREGVQVTIEIEKAEGASSYEVYRISGGKTRKIGTATENRTVIDKKPYKRVARYYAVAVSADGKTKSKAGEEKTLRLARTSRIQKVKAEKKGIRISWKKEKSATKYVLYRSAKKNSGYHKLQTISRRKNSCLDKSAKKNRKYYYKIVVVDKKQASLMSRPSKKVKRK